MESEDAAEGERKEAEMKVESLTSIVKMFELKAKNSHEQSEFVKQVSRCFVKTETGFYRDLNSDRTNH